MRRNGGLWMVTLDNREPESYEELPYYFRTRATAKAWVAERESWRAFGEWPWREDDRLTIVAAPDSLRESDIAWDDE